MSERGEKRLMLRVGNAGVTKGVSIKRIGALVALIWITISGHGDAMAGWRIDSHRYLQSYHGENACTDCHSDIDESVRHPEPGNVTKKMEDFFDADKCLECHDMDNDPEFQKEGAFDKYWPKVEHIGLD